MEEEIIIPPMDITPEELARRLLSLPPDPSEDEGHGQDEAEGES